MIPYFRGERTGSPHEYLFWRFWDPTAVRSGNWKFLKEFLSSGHRNYMNRACQKGPLPVKGSCTTTILVYLQTRAFSRMIPGAVLVWMNGSSGSPGDLRPKNLVYMGHMMTPAMLFTWVCPIQRVSYQALRPVRITIHSTITRW